VTYDEGMPPSQSSAAPSGPARELAGPGEPGGEPRQLAEELGRRDDGSRQAGQERGQLAEEARWLDGEERAAWLGLVRLLTKLPPALDTQLQRDAGVSFFEYNVLAMLSEQPDRTLRMSHLATLTSASLSRLSHVAKRLETHGLLRRALDPEDGRCTNAILTDAGLELVTRTAPAHVKEVRELVIDAVSPAQLRQLRQATERILAKVDPQGSTQPPWFT
jgi:DNA-binding MarR family transcriptional regulator